MSDAPLSFKCIREGAPFDASELPKLPPRAMKAMLAVLKENGVDPTAKLNEKDPATLVALNEVATVLVHASLKRMAGGALPLAAVAEDEDMEMVLRAFRALRDANPLFFPKSAADAPPLVEADADPQ